MTVLTSLDAGDLAADGIAGSVEEAVTRRARLAEAAGCAGVIASPQEAAAIRAVVGRGFLVITPGVRLAAASDDQKRVATPRAARAAGADAVVVGRPIRDAARSPRRRRRLRARARLSADLVARVVYGVHPVREALRSGKVQALFVAEGETGPALKEILDAARDANVQPIPHLRTQLDALAHGGVHQGAVAIVGEYNYAQLDELIQRGRASAGEPPLILVLDSVQDPQNLGALVRTAHVAGVHGIVIPKDRAVGITPTVVKTSAGATEHMKIATVVNIARALEELKEANVWIAGAVAAGGSKAPWEIDFTGAHRARPRRRRQGHPPAGAARLRPAGEDPDVRQGRVAQRRRRRRDAALRSGSRSATVQPH